MISICNFSFWLRSIRKGINKKNWWSSHLFAFFFPKKYQFNQLIAKDLVELIFLGLCLWRWKTCFLVIYSSLNSVQLIFLGLCIMLAYELGYFLKGIVIDYRWSCLVSYVHHIYWLCLDIVLIVVNCLCMITWPMVAYKNICIPLMVI